MELLWSDDAWADFERWLDNDKRVVKRIRKIIKSILREPFTGIGKPEPLKGTYSGLWSRRINDEHRIIYLVTKDHISIVAVRFHYNK
ncbi:Txe/YoeB family addiction module toxin [Fructobacillus sp. CRL 2054]|uniref:Txe/YoeB family addiction module toxin n=1 Tax=Fructobacillus sp. CRL 2054 TaxID=2763007 RepID=UPI002379B400|nr:Txe/YoeB family addiction module toxin [Fructobacillus sp. CRL 2054]MDD9138910.1 Txe/YoeB family addiction module toxin [Fructobacillus sp. CRL 2054]